MKLETLLKMFAATNADELRIEPDTKPYFVSATERTDAAEIVLTSANISQLIFPLIPLEEKLRLSSLPQILFRHTNELGMFGITVSKSPSGLTAAIKKISVPLIEFGADQTSHLTASIEPVAPLSSAAETTPSAKPFSVAPPQNVVTVPPSISKAVPEIQIASENGESIAPAPFLKMPIDNEQFASVEIIDEEFEETILDEDLPMPSPLQNSVEANGNRYTQGSPPNPSEVNGYSTHTVADSPAASRKTASPKMDALFYKMAELKASDLHLCVSMPPMMRVDGKMATLGEGLEPISEAAMKDLLYTIMPESNREEFERRHDTDFAYEIKGLARFRANIFMDRKGMGGVFRIIPNQILTAEKLGLSKAILDLCNLSKGLVVVTGPTGSGKSTTLCAMIDYVNRNREDHIITIEDPIEFVHENQKCLLNQREVHNHTDSFKDALRAALREDPDILLVGEMRDLETISIAIETAETGHLVFGTLHTTTAPSTVDRIIDQFPADRQQQIRVMLSESLKGVIAQTLLPKIGGGRIAALEILIITPAISNQIREGKTFQIASAMQTGKQHGMVTLNDSLVELVVKGSVEPRQAYLKAVDKPGIEALFKRNDINIAKFKEIFE